MPITLQCTNKGCYQNQQPYIDPSDDKVYCSVCNSEISVTIFVKNQMKMFKQFKQKKKVSYAVKCNHCNNEDRPVMMNNEFYCSSCKKLIDNLTSIFKDMLRDKFKKMKG